MDRCHSSNCTVGRSDICSDIHLVFSLPGGLGETIDIAVANGKFDLGATNFDLKDATMWISFKRHVFPCLPLSISMVMRISHLFDEARKKCMDDAI